MSLRERIQQRARPTDTWPLRIQDPAAALAHLESVDTAWRLALVAYGQDSAEVAAAAAQLEEARARVAACYEMVQLEAVSPPDFEALAAQHATDELDRNGERKAWDDAFPQALFLACVRADLEPDEWLQLLGDKPVELDGPLADAVFTEGEKIQLLNTVVHLNMRVPDARLPKGWTPTPS